MGFWSIEREKSGGGRELDIREPLGAWDDDEGDERARRGGPALPLPFCGPWQSAVRRAGRRGV